MTQNIYDNETFFAGYSQLPRSVLGLDGAPEWMVLRGLLPDLRGLRVLDLGCGFGWFCRWAQAHGAAQVLGIDISERMLARAKDETKGAGVTYLRANLEDVDLAPNSVDLVYSSLALHYIENLPSLIAKVHAAMAPGGKLIFSVEHPIYTAPGNPGWTTDANGQKTWPVDRYLDEGARATDWLAKGVIKQHRTIATYLNTLIAAGFTLAYIEEWAPSLSQIASEPDWADERQRPPFLLVACNR
ncbi:class I SAM-dependent methyltransferase [Dongia soli]|uniref:Class I SAM-dependent methyltransferase n=1 Tax=Dongia soli TaxID=600628 RepID=A0ABU5E771_9PROT|nr:class I SAM-dependent methyltransferase [Dongia soli]MDY0882136.1 class I SAM-dependent methyltransferase [Dongia soli]